MCSRTVYLRFEILIGIFYKGSITLEITETNQETICWQVLDYDYKMHVYIKLSCCQYERLYPFENYLQDKILSELLSFILTAWHRLHDVWNLSHFLSNRLSLRLTNFSILHVIAFIKFNGLL